MPLRSRYPGLLRSSRRAQMTRGQEFDSPEAHVHFIVLNRALILPA